MNRTSSMRRRPKTVVLAGLLTVGVAFGAIVGPVGAADDPTTTVEAPTTEAPTTEAPTTEAPTTEPPATEAPPTSVEPLEEGATLGTTYMRGCTVIIPATVEGGGAYNLTVWDEGEQIGEVSRNFADHETGNFEYPLTHAPAQIVSPGLGYILYGPSGAEVADSDPDTPGAEVMKNCTSPAARAKAVSQATPASAVKATPKFTG